MATKQELQDRISQLEEAGEQAYAALDTLGSALGYIDEDEDEDDDGDDLDGDTDEQ